MTTFISCWDDRRTEKKPIILFFFPSLSTRIKSNCIKLNWCDSAIVAEAKCCFRMNHSSVRASLTSSELLYFTLICTARARKGRNERQVWGGWEVKWDSHEGSKGVLHYINPPTYRLSLSLSLSRFHIVSFPWAFLSTMNTASSSLEKESFCRKWEMGEKKQQKRKRKENLSSQSAFFWTYPINLNGRKQ